MLTLKYVAKVARFLYQTGGYDAQSRCYTSRRTNPRNKRGVGGLEAITIRLKYEEDPKTGHMRLIQR